METILQDNTIKNDRIEVDLIRSFSTGQVFGAKIWTVERYENKEGRFGVSEAQCNNRNEGLKCAVQYELIIDKLKCG